jgi:hypothetical protein
MKHWKHMLGAVLFSVLLPFCAFAQTQQPVYTPPDVAEFGLEAHNQHLAVIQTTASSIDEALLLRDELTRKGALVSIITSPQRMLAWVPSNITGAVLNTRLAAATGSIGVLTVSYNSAEFNSQQSGVVIQSAENDADRAIVEYLDFIKRRLSDEEQEHIRRAGDEQWARMQAMPELNCVRSFETNEASGRELPQGIPTLDGGDPLIQRATALRGLVTHTSFFMESAAGTGSWDWDNTVYNNYRNLYIAGINYWVTFAAAYGKVVSMYWRLYTPTGGYALVTGEPTVVGENVFIREIVRRFYTPTSSDQPPTWSGIGDALRYCWWYNNKIRAATSADEAICGFIAYKPSGDAGIWPHASMLIWSGGDVEGVYFTMDTRYSGNDPFSLPMRNVVAHEVGHLWGCPDEYLTDNCGTTYRGIVNVNCQADRPAYKQPGYTMHGWDGIMKGNYTGGTSLATPVFTGVQLAANSIPSRLFLSTPSGIPLTFRNEDNRGEVTRTTPTAIPMGYYYRFKLIAPASRTIGTTKYYFDYWIVRRLDGTTSNIDYYANELPSYAVSSTETNPIVRVTATYTSTPPDVFSVNTTVTANLAPGGTSASPAPAIALRWRNKYNMADAQTKIEYEASSGNWRELGNNHIPIGPFNVGINQWTGVFIYAVPGTSGTGANAIQSSREYRFRIVGYFNTNRGTPSQVAAVTTRPATPADTVFCYDPSEPSTTSNPRVLSSSGSGMTPYKVRGALVITGVTGEFSWFIPQGDFYRLTAINLSSGIFGEVVRVSLRLRPGSLFVPKLRALRAGTTTHINATREGNVWIVRLNTDGEYTIKVEADISQSISYDLVDRTGGHFAFGEYDLEIERVTTTPTVYVPPVDYVRLFLVRPFPGELIAEPHPHPDLFIRGLRRSALQPFRLMYVPPPGFTFLSFGGDLGTLPGNPGEIPLSTNTPSGTYRLYPNIRPIDPKLAELVVIFPEGPTGPFDYRRTGSIGSTLVAEAHPPADYNFVGWGGDTTTTTNPLNVVMWRSKKLIAHYRPKPCVPEPMKAWRHNLAFVNARNTQVALEYAMQPGAGDGLEAGQVDLPPVPPPTAFDIRWINITGSQGSITDHRAIKPSHIYQGRVQTGPTNPVQMTWPNPPASPNASFTLKIQGVAGSIDMRTTSNHTFADEGTYIFTIEVKEKTCPEPSNQNDIVVTPVDIDNKEWPCIRLLLELRDRQTGQLRPFANPYNLRFEEATHGGGGEPTRLTGFEQLDSLLVARFCFDPDKPGRDREIQIINDDDDPDKEKDTTRLRIPLPLPDGNEDPVRFAWKIPGGWQMISLPVDIKDAEAATVFSDPMVTLYQFNTTTGAYEGVSGMNFGRGYWLKSEGYGTVLTGVNRYIHEWSGLNGIGEPYGYGWNMIGALSKSLAASAVQATPSAGLKSLFGWDPNSGYIIPGTVEPGKGYWVRVDPGTKLRMETTPVREGSSSQYSKIVDALDIRGLLIATQDGQGARVLHVSGTAPTADLLEALAIPAPPPEGLFDLRSADNTLFLFEGANTLSLRGEGRTRISLAPVTQVRIEVRDETGTLLAVLNSDVGNEAIINVHGSRTLYLSVSIPSAATAYQLGGNYPNPFTLNGRTWIPYTLSEDIDVRIQVYDLLGRRLRTLVSAKQNAGAKLASWDGRDEYGAVLPAGMYVYRLETPVGTISRILTIVR